MTITVEQIKEAAEWINRQLPGTTAYEGHPLWVIGKVLEEAANSGWQPIETAPRDGTCFLGFDPFLNCVFIGHMFKFHDGFKFVANALVRDATHWRPLPQPPKDALEQAEGDDGRLF